jgi:Gas vesicle synthesis protein GvpL/GvpF
MSPSQTPLLLYGIVLSDGHALPEVPGAAGGTRLISYRDVGAVVSDQKSFVLDDVDSTRIEEHRAIVDAVFHIAPVLPAPVGVVFRSSDALTRWMELHYVSLTGALEFVEDRAAARVHISYTANNSGRANAAGADADIANAANEAVRALRRSAVMAVPLAYDAASGRVSSAAFLVERDHWKEFLRAVADQHEAHHALKFDVTGPWAPYDFVQMQFGS